MDLITITVYRRTDGSQMRSKIIAFPGIKGRL